MPQRGIRNNNPGNIRLNQTAWQGLAPAAQQTDGVFCIFVDPVWGLRAILVIFHTYESRGLNTVTKWITSWAPPSDNNDTAAYIANVCAAVGCGPDDPVDITYQAVAVPVLKAVVQQENGEQPYDDATLIKAFGLAFPAVA